jgi:hypothetical protein
MVLMPKPAGGPRGMAVLAGALVIAAARLLSAAEPPAPPALHLSVAATSLSVERLRDGGAAWAALPEQTIHLNRTPPLYEGDALDDGYRPRAQVSLARSGDHLLVRLSWSDSTESRPAPAERVPDTGQAAVYKEHSLDIERFADAACVMVPKTTGEQKTYPALMMGEKNAPVDLYYWHLVKGFQRLEAAGRSTTTRTGETFPGSARYTGKGWEVVFELPALPALTPICLAVWDGDRMQRDGLKYYSLWYEVGP